MCLTRQSGDDAPPWQSHASVFPCRLTTPPPNYNLRNMSQWHHEFAETKESWEIGYDRSTDHLNYMNIALDEARKSPPKPTNFRVGACLVAYHPKLPEHSNIELLDTGYTLECEGNTHAEQCCFIKLATTYNCSEFELGLHYRTHMAFIRRWSRAISVR